MESLDQPLFNAGQLAERLGVSVRTIWRWKNAGLIPSCQPAGAGGAVRFPADVVDRIQHAAQGDLAASPSVPLPRMLPGFKPRWEQE